MQNSKPIPPDPAYIEALKRERERLIEAKRFETYAPSRLKIRPKKGDIVPFRINRAQLFLHDAIEKQRAETGRVRALVLKARQEGISTYVAGRFYWKTSQEKGKRTYILTHEQSASDNLFGMAARFHEHDPDAPTTKAANAKELDFADLDSGYRVGTAGTKAVGRSSTIQYFHGSEVALWPHAKEHLAGVLRAVGDVEGTEVILESTANGVGNAFHTLWQAAEAGQSDYIAIFLPWFWQTEYRKPAPPDFRLTSEEREYQDLHALDDEQMAWRRAAIAEFSGDEDLFRQEYPATAAEAFQITGSKSYITPASVLKARKSAHDGIGALVIGADPARFGNDRFSLAWRRGRKAHKVESRNKIDVVDGANWIRQVIDRDKPAKVFVDLGGLGAGVVDILHSWDEKYTEVVVGVNFGGKPMAPDEFLNDGKNTKIPGPRNRRSEMWKNMKEWLEQEGGVDVPDSDSLQADLCGPMFRYDMDQRLILESKEDMARRGIRSPDEGDALALTFAEPVFYESPNKRRPVVNPRARDERIGV